MAFRETDLYTYIHIYQYVTAAAAGYLATWGVDLYIRGGSWLVTFMLHLYMHKRFA